MLSGVAEPLLDDFAATGTSLLYSDSDRAFTKALPGTKSLPGFRPVSGCDPRGWEWPRRSDRPVRHRQSVH